jgi:class 3 adenylate cyclase/tetratricopeptide (TPR) repeat protein
MPACQHCGEDNPDRARFCLACGEALARVCPSCGDENPERARFCLSCGTPLAAQAARSGPREVRKTVTVVFCDVAGSTSLGESLDPESLRHVMGRYFDEMRAALERHGGTVEKFIGDAVMAVFGIPVVHEDDALRAVRAAAEMRDARVRLNAELEDAYGVSIDARIGVNTGEVVAGDAAEGQRYATGDAVNVAARLEQAATGGEILIGEETYRLVRGAVRVEPVEPLVLKGKARPVPAYRLVEVLATVDPIGRRRDAPLVGRDRELRRLGEIFARARSDPGCWLVTVLGAAGLGKSRLVDEFLDSLGGVRRLGGRCLPYGEGITFWPVAEIVRAAAGIGEGESVEEAIAKIEVLCADPIARDRVAAAIGLADGSGSVEETFWGVRRLVEALAEDGPLVLGFDDLHWAEPTLLDLVEYLSGWIRDLPVLILCQGRMELLEARPGWGTASNAAVISLEPLTSDQSVELIDSLLRETALPAATRSRILDVAGGNPLFVEQMLAMLGDEGDEVAVPPTIQALLAARLDRLDPDERAVLERASVEGAVFHRGAVADLGVADALPQLMTLVRRELIRPARAVFPGEDAFCFHHLLIRDAAYDSMPKQTRADLHERYAGWLERTSGERAPEYEEILGYHLESAYRLRTELGPADERARGLALSAGGRLLEAGRRARGRGDMGAAVNLWSRARKLLPETDPRRLGLVPDLGEALCEAGEFERAGELLRDGRERAEAAGDAAAAGYCALGLIGMRLQVDPGARTSELADEIEQLIALYAGAGDDLGLLRARRTLAGVRWLECRIEDTAAQLEHAVTHARRTGRRGEEIDSLAWLAFCHRYGPTEAETGKRICAELLAAGEGDPGLEASVSLARAGLDAIQGRFEEGRAGFARGRSVLSELGMPVLVAAATQAAGRLELLAGDPAAAERELRAGYDALKAMGESGHLSTSAALLAEAVLAQGRLDEADRLAAESSGLAAEDDRISQVLWRSARARVRAREGRHAEAEALVREAIDVVLTTDHLEEQARAHADHAEVLELAGRRAEARAELERALELYERKGHEVGSSAVRRRLSADATAAAS